MFLPIWPPKASISLTTVPLAGPPTDGLHGMKATISSPIVKSNVFWPICALARAASQPA